MPNYTDCAGVILTWIIIFCTSVEKRLVSQQFGAYEKSLKTKTSLRDIRMPENLVEDLKQNRDWFRLADDNFDEKQDEYYLAVGLGKQPLYPPR